MGAGILLRLFSFPFLFKTKEFDFSIVFGLIVALVVVLVLVCLLLFEYLGWCSGGDIYFL